MAPHDNTTDFFRLYTHMRETGYSFNQLLVLDSLGRKPATLSALCKRFDLTRQTLGIYHLPKLLEDGLVAKENLGQKFDQRYKILVLTEEGRRFVEDMHQEITQGGGCEL